MQAKQHLCEWPQTRFVCVPDRKEMQIKIYIKMFCITHVLLLLHLAITNQQQAASDSIMNDFVDVCLHKVFYKFREDSQTNVSLLFCQLQTAL